MSKRFGFGVETASPLQRDILRIAEGIQPISAEGRKALRADSIPARPKELCILSGVRGGKSLLAACIAVHASMHCDVSKLRHGEMPRISIVSLTMDLAKVVYGHLHTSIAAQPALKSMLLSETADSVVLRHPTGTPIEIKVVAGSRAGSSLIARWSAGVIFDEAPRMLGSEEGVINLEDARAATSGRMLPGAQVVYIGSPWAPWGPVYRMVNEHHGKPSRHIVVLRAPSYEMNPVWWTPEMIDEERNGPLGYAFSANVEAEFLAPHSGLFGAELDGCIRKGVKSLEPDPLNSYVGAVDPAARGNAFTLVIQTSEASVRKVAFCKQWLGSKEKPLKFAEVFAEIAPIARKYRLETLRTDQWSYDAIREHAASEGLTLTMESLTTQEKADQWMKVRSEMVNMKRELVDEPQLIDDLRRLVKRVTTQGGISIDEPRTEDGRHCDFAPALLRCETQHIEDRQHIQTEAERQEAEVERMKESALRSIGGDGKSGRAGFRRGR